MTLSNQHNDTEHDDYIYINTQNKDTQHNDTKHKLKNCDTQHNIAEFWVWLMLSGAFSIVMLEIFILTVIMSNVIMLGVVVPSICMYIWQG